MQLQNAKVVVTGGSSGIGKATAKLLIEKGAKVLITGRNAEKLEKVAQEIGATPLALDMTDTAEFEQAAKKAQELVGGPIDVLINNAGIGEYAPLGEIRLEQFQKVYMTNVFGLSLLTQAFLPQLKAQKGNIVNIASTAGLKGFATGSIYSSSKFLPFVDSPNAGRPNSAPTIFGCNSSTLQRLLLLFFSTGQKKRSN